MLFTADPSGVPEHLKRRVERLLIKGIRETEENPANLESACAFWKTVLKISNNTSAAAHWNLGICHWFNGEMNIAEKHFRMSEKVGGPDWISGSRVDIVSRFDEEKKRIERSRELEVVE